MRQCVPQLCSPDPGDRPGSLEDEDHAHLMTVLRNAVAKRQCWTHAPEPPRARGAKPAAVARSRRMDAGVSAECPDRARRPGGVRVRAWLAPAPVSGCRSQTHLRARSRVVRCGRRRERVRTPARVPRREPSMSRWRSLERHTSPNHPYGTPLRGLAAMTLLSATGVPVGVPHVI